MKKKRHRKVSKERGVSGDVEEKKELAFGEMTRCNSSLLSRLRLPIILFFAFLWRAVFLYSFLKTPQSRILLDFSDAHTYHQFAQALLHDWSGGPNVFYYGPGYFYSLACLYFLFGVKLKVVYFFQLVLSLFTVFFVDRITFHLTRDKKTASWVACFYAFSGISIFYMSRLLIVTLAAFFFTLFFWIALLALKKRTLLWFFLCGIIFGLSALVRANILLFFPVFCALIFFHSKLSRKASLKLIAAFFAAVFIVIAPVTIRNYIKGGEFVLITANAGVNFYIGNAPDSKGYFDYPASLKKISKEIESEDLSPARKSSFYVGKIKSFVLKHPVQFLKLNLKKLSFFFWGKEIPNNENYEIEKNDFTILQLCLQSSFLMPWFLFSLLFLSFRRRKEFLPLLLFVYFYIFSIVIFFILSRYRAPILPAFSILGGIALLEVFRSKGKWLKGLSVLCFFLFFWLLNLNYVTVAVADAPQAFVNKGLLLTKAGKLDLALAEYQKALKKNPSYPLALFNMGIHYYHQGKWVKAMAYLEKAVKGDKDNAEYHFSFGQALEKAGRIVAAKKEMESAYAIEKSKRYGNSLAILYAKHGQLPKAYQIWLDLQKLNPTDADVLKNLKQAKMLLSK